MVGDEQDPGAAYPFDAPGAEVEPDPGEPGGEGWAVVLYDDAVHMRHHVVFQVIKALRCGIDLAQSIVDRVERNGKGVVSITTRPKARSIQHVLQEIRLKTELRKVT